MLQLTESSKPLKNLVLVRFILFIVLGFIMINININAAEITPLVEADWLKQNLSRVQVLDIRNELSTEIIPGSYHTAYKEWRSSDKKNPGGVPSLEVLQGNIDRLGLHSNNHYVIVFAGKNSTDFGSAARVYWNLKYIGFDKLSILNGGIYSYATLPNVKWSDAHSSPSDIKSYQVTYRDGYIVNTDEIVETSKDPNKVDALLIDARNNAQFTGDKKHPAAVRFGAINGARQIWQGDWFRNDSAFLKSISQLQEQAEAYNIPRTLPLYSYCNTGHWAASNWFILSEVLNYKNVKLYPDSFVKYSQLVEAEIVNEPSRIELLWREIKNWF